MRIVVGKEIDAGRLARLRKTFPEVAFVAFRDDPDAMREADAFLGRIPLALEIREGGDAGAPPAASDGVHAKPFVAIAERLSAWLAANG